MDVTAPSGGPDQGALFTARPPSSQAPPGAPAGDGAGTATGGGLRVLVIEDNQDAAETLGELLELSGHEVKLALDGTAGVATAREISPHVVISDLGLPGELDGYAVAHALRAEPSLRGVYLIALSGYASEDARRRSREAGFDMHLAKPPDISRLEKILADLGRR